MHYFLIITGAIQLVPAKQPAVERQCSETARAEDIGKTVLSQYVEIKVVFFFEDLFQGVHFWGMPPPPC